MSNSKWTPEQMDALLAQSQANDPQDWRENPANQDADDERDGLLPASAPEAAAVTMSESDRIRLIRESNSEAEEYSSRTEGRWM